MNDEPVLDLPELDRKAALAEGLAAQDKKPIMSPAEVEAMGALAKRGGFQVPIERDKLLALAASHEALRARLRELVQVNTSAYDFCKEYPEKFVPAEEGMKPVGMAEFVAAYEAAAEAVE